LNFDSLTVLDYIRTSIEILMQMKLEEEKLANGIESSRKTQNKHKKKEMIPPSQNASSSMLLYNDNKMISLSSSTISEG